MQGPYWNYTFFFLFLGTKTKLCWVDSGIQYRTVWNTFYCRCLPYYPKLRLSCCRETSSVSHFIIMVSCICMHFKLVLIFSLNLHHFMHLKGRFLEILYKTSPLCKTGGRPLLHYTTQRFLKTMPERLVCPRWMKVGSLCVTLSWNVLKQITVGCSFSPNNPLISKY